MIENNAIYFEVPRGGSYMRRLRHASNILFHSRKSISTEKLEKDGFGVRNTGVKFVLLTRLHRSVMVVPLSRGLYRRIAYPGMAVGLLIVIFPFFPHASECYYFL